MWNKIRRFIPALVISIITIVLMVAVIFVLLKKDVKDDPTVTELTLWDVDWELIELLDLYKQMNPEFEYKINTFTYQALYDPPPGHEWLEDQFQDTGEDVPDIICIDMPYAMKYIDGDMSMYMASYEELGIDVDRLLKKNEIPQYIIDEGRNANGELMALPFKSQGGAFIYRRSIALDVWGNDDPEFIENKIGPGWEEFLSAAEELKAKGYGIVSTVEDIGNVVLWNSDQEWVVDGTLYIDPKREAYLDIAKELVDAGYTNNTAEGVWMDSWFDDMKGTGEKQIFGYFGSSWMIDILKDSCGGEKVGEGTYGDWAVCLPTYGFSFYNHCIMVNKDTKLKKTIAEIVEWITLDSSETGAQYIIANEMNNLQVVSKEAVPSGKVMKNTDDSLDFLGGQNMFKIYLQADQMVNSRIMTEHDANIDNYWKNSVNEYAMGIKTREQAIKDFKNRVNIECGIPTTP